MPPRTQYAKHGDLNIAYQVTGDGPIDILVVPSFVSNIEFWWAHPVMKAWWDRVTSFARLILFDKLGTGCSDPVSGPRTLEQRSDEIKAVMEAVGCERPVLFGLSEGGPSSIVFAATHPGQVQALVLFGTFASVGLVDASPDEIRAELAKDGVAERYWPTVAQIERVADSDSGFSIAGETARRSRCSCPTWAMRSSRRRRSGCARAPAWPAPPWSPQR